MVELMRKNESVQKNLEERLVVSLSKCFHRYFDAGGLGLKNVDLKGLSNSALKQGANSHSGDNLELCASLMDSNPGYLKSINYLKVNGEKRKAAVLVRKGLKIGVSEKDKQAQKIEAAKKDLVIKDGV